VKPLCSLLVLLAALAVHVPVWAQGAVAIDIRRGADKRAVVAVPPFLAQPGLETAAREISQVISYDLEFSGLFLALPPNEYPPGFVGFDPDVNKINLDPWRQTRAEHIVFGLITLEGDTLVAELRLFDLFSKQQIVGRSLRAQRDLPRLLAHRFTEEVIRYVDGTPGIGTSEICFSAVAGHNVKEIFVADYDGANARQVTQHGTVSIMPQMSPDGSRIAYLSYKDRYCFLYIYDRGTGKSTPLSKEVGLNAAPAWSPDGSHLAIVLSKDANTEIYLRNADGTGLKRLTNNKAGDTSPTFDPSDQRIAFVSDRGGSPQIWVMNADGSGARRLSVQGGNAYDPEWSPDGKWIAYVGERRGEGLEIYIMDAETGQNYQRLTNSPGSNESPAWSADGRHIMFSTTRNGRAELYSYTIKTGEERPVPNIATRAQGPSWGPRRGN